MTEREMGSDALHQLRNAQAEKAALQSMLSRASDEIEELIESDCEHENKEKAVQAVKRFRRAASL